MPAKIHDEFSDLPISRQEKYQRRMDKKRRCRLCGGPLARKDDGTLATLCEKHLKTHRLSRLASYHDVL